jgi:hypothetical protein
MRSGRWLLLLVAAMLLGSIAVILATGGAAGAHHHAAFAPDPAAPTAGAAAKLPRCHTRDLRAHVVPGSPGAGQRYATIELQNRSRHRCTVTGYPGAQLVRRGAEVPTRVVRVRGPKIRTVRLAPGAKASADWHWGAIPSGREPRTGACEPSADHVRITPPDERRSLRVRWRLGPVCGGGRIETKPFRIAPKAHTGA